jgi:aspartyl-tRNA(Asn)/glutamyl-tRNA(Gln) amidotransferase subunit B
MRCDANVSVKRSQDTELGERTEIKNINSFKFVEQAINSEIQRQIETLEAGEKIVRETRLYDEVTNETRSMRSKEASQDYRYFPDPDLLPLHVSDALIETIKSELPELAEAKKLRFIKELQLDDYDASLISKEIDLATYFEKVVAHCGEPKLAANWIITDLYAKLNRDNLDIKDSLVTPQMLAQVILKIKDQTLSSKTAKTLFDSLWESPGEPSERIQELGLQQIDDSSELSLIVDKVLNENPEQLQQLKNGKSKVLGYFVGLVMQETKGKANPQKVNELIHASIE